jgi:hypothetical protein
MQHFDNAVFKINNEVCAQNSNLIASKARNDEDISCRAKRDLNTKLATFELKISRNYLSYNKAPDNLLSYTLNLGTGTHQFNLDNEAKGYLAGLGVTENYDWTYNYVYFGTRPETVPDVVETEPVQGGENTDEGENKTVNSCGSAVAFAPVMLISAISGMAVVVTRKKRNKFLIGG